MLCGLPDDRLNFMCQSSIYSFPVLCDPNRAALDRFVRIGTFDYQKIA